MPDKKTRLTRPIHPMPDMIRTRLEQDDLLADFFARPAYQQNDYLGWIDRAKQESTRTKRLEQMLDELRIGGIYMKMAHPASEKR